MVLTFVFQAKFCRRIFSKNQDMLQNYQTRKTRYFIIVMIRKKIAQIHEYDKSLVTEIWLKISVQNAMKFISI